MGEETEIFLVRHALTDFNEQGIFQGISDRPLSTNGQQQARLLCERFIKEGHKIDRIYVSALRRTTETIRPLADALGLEPLVYPAIGEVDGGRLEGCYQRDNLQNYPEVIDDLMKRPYYAQLPGGESGRQVYERMVKALHELAELNKGKTIIVVSHGFALQMLSAFLQGIEPEHAPRCISSNTGVTHLFWQNGKIVLDYLFDASHLPEKWRESQENRNTEAYLKAQSK